MIKKILEKILLSKDERKLGQQLLSSGLSNIEVTNRGTIIACGKQIAQTPEFKKIIVDFKKTKYTK